MDTGLKSVREVVSRATLAPGQRDKLLETLDRMPPLYQGLEETYESRFHDAIIQAARSMFRNLAEADAESPDAPQVADRMFAKLQAMHEKLGIPALGIKAPAPARAAKPARKKV